MVLDGLAVEDRPLAVGYFVLDTLRTLFQTGIKAADDIRIHVALLDPRELEELSKTVSVFVAPKPVDDLSSLYKITVAVSRGDEDIL